MNKTQTYTPRSLQDIKPEPDIKPEAKLLFIDHMQNDDDMLNATVVNKIIIKDNLPAIVGEPNLDIVRKVIENNKNKNMDLKVLKFDEFKILNEAYEFSKTCVDWDEDEIEDLQNLTGYDEWSNNEYSINDDLLNSGTIEIIGEPTFNKLTGGYEFPRNEKVEYYAINHDYDVVFAYTDNDVHYFFEKV